MPCVLVTGADGFVGKALCAEMISKGWEVRASIRAPNKINSLPHGVEAAIKAGIKRVILFSRIVYLECERYRLSAIQSSIDLVH